MKLFVKLVLAASILLPVSGVFADVLLMDKIAQEPGNSSAGVLRPHRYMSMNQVRGKFGEPVTVLPWVGEPPITRWVYDDYTVYFEHDRVIHSVVNP